MAGRTNDAKREALMRQMAALAEEVARIDSPPEEPFDDGDVLTWERRFGETGPSYTYAAVRANCKWFVTDRTSMPLLWDTLWTKHLRHADGPVWCATEWTEQELEA